MSLLGGTHIAQDASDVLEPAVLKLDDASTRLEGFLPDCLVSPLQRRGGELAFPPSSQVMWTLLSPDL